MITTSIFIDDSRWQEWLQALQATPRLTHLSCKVDLLTDAAFCKEAERLGFSLAVIQELLPPEVAFFLSNQDNLHSFGSLKKDILGTMLAADALQPQHFSVPLRLDDPAPENEQSRTQRCVAFLRKLLWMPLSANYRIGIPVRCPAPFPKSQEQARAISICQAADSQRIGIELQVFSGDFDDAPDIPALLEPLMPHLSAITFHYAPHLSDVLFDDEVSEWASFLQKSNFDGAVTFYPHPHPEDVIQNLCAAAQQWADFFSLS